MSEVRLSGDENTGTGKAEVKTSSYVLPPSVPTQEAPGGVRFDFNAGLRVGFPDDGSRYRLLFRDLDSGLVLFCMDAEPGSMVVSRKRYFVRFGLEIYRADCLEKPVFRHDLDLSGREVLVQIPHGALGDAIAWFSYVDRFRRKHGCRIHVMMQEEIACIFRKQYPEIDFVTMKQAEKLTPYATYNLGLFFGGEECMDGQPYDFREVGLHRTAGHILGLEDLGDDPPRVDLTAERKIDGPYVVIATQASSQCKYWNNPSGWREVIMWLKKQGYRVLCIDRMAEYGCGYVCNRIPWGCEDFTGDLPLQDRIDIIKDADMFIGLSSGLSWLAWCCRVPVVMISGFTDPVNEFHTPYRIINPSVCHGCWNDARCTFDHGDFLWCPRKNSSDEKFECTKAVTGKMVIAKIRRVMEDRRKNGTGSYQSDGEQAFHDARG